MDVDFKQGYRIEVGLSKKDVEELIWRNKILSRGILTGAETIELYALENENERDRMVIEEERMPATITYCPKTYHSPEGMKELQRSDKVYAKYIGNGDVYIFMTQLTAMRIHPDGILEMNAQLPQILKQCPNNNVRISTKIPF